MYPFFPFFDILFIFSCAPTFKLSNGLLEEINKALVSIIKVREVFGIGLIEEIVKFFFYFNVINNVSMYVD